MRRPVEISFDLPASPDRAYDAFLSSRDHSAFLGSESHFTARVGAVWDAWDGYCSGKIAFLAPGHLIALTWTAQDWKPGEDSVAVVRFDEFLAGCRVTITHHGVPAGREDELEKGWKDFYEKTMTAWFARQAGIAPAPAPKTTSKKSAGSAKSASGKVGAKPSPQKPSGKPAAKTALKATSKFARKSAPHAAKTAPKKKK